MPYKSNAPDAIARLRRGIDAGLTAAAQNVHGKIRQRLLRGYTTGNFAHQMRGVAGRVMYTVPFDRGTGRAIAIGTSTTAVPYELYWELGHQNVFTRRYERVEIWRPTLEANRGRIEAIVARNIQRFTGGASAVTTITTAFRSAA